MLKPGDAAPELAMRHGSPAWVLFYPLAFAPTCRADLRALHEAASRLGHPEHRLLVVSVDRLEQAQAFLEFLKADRLVAVEDPTLSLAEAFGVRRREQVAERASFLLDAEGRVVRAALHDLCFPRPLDDLEGWIT